MMNLSTKSLHKALISKLASPAYTDGTYNLLTGETVEFSKGFQVSFCQVGDNYTDDDYEFIVAMMKEASTDGIVYAGKFDGEPELSFYFTDKLEAIKYAKMFNQVSIWDWKNGDEIKTGGTGKR